METRYISLNTAEEMNNWATGQLGRMAFDFTQTYGMPLEAFEDLLKQKAPTPFERFVAALEYYKSKGIIYKYGGNN